MQTSLRKSLIVSAFILSASIIGPSASADPGEDIHWQSVIGIIQGNNVVGSGSGAVTGVPGPWSAQGGRVKVDLDHGRIDFDIDGLVFAAGNAIGTTGTVTQEGELQ